MKYAGTPSLASGVTIPQDDKTNLSASQILDTETNCAAG